MNLVCLQKSNITLSLIGLKISDKVSYDGRTIAEKNTVFTVAFWFVQIMLKGVNQFGKQCVKIFIA